MEYISIFLSTTSPWLVEDVPEGSGQILRWDLPQAITGSKISLSSYSVRANRKFQPVRICCSLIHDNWKNPDSCFGDIYHGHSLYSDDRWDMAGREYRTIEIKFESL